MSYVVLARKWRPRQFDEVVGQEHVARTLKNAIEQDRVAHAFLFAGARGVGKTSTARILAKALNCKSVEEPTPTPCDDCVSCNEIAGGQAVDVFEIDGASNRGINEIRELRESVRYAPSRDRFKIYIIDEVHMLTTEAFNALLKTLEEPPPHAKFIFATTEPQKIPVTILSRCQRYDFKRIGQKDIVEHLQNLCGEEGLDAETSALQIIARQAAGGMRDALSLLDQIISFAGDEITEKQVIEILGVANRKHLFELSEAVLSKEVESALQVLDEVNRYGYDLNQFAAELVSHFRDLMVIRVVENPETVTELTATEIEAASAQVDGVEPNLLQRCFDVMVEGATEMKHSSYPKLLFEMTLVRLAALEPLVGIDLLVDRLHALEEDIGEEVEATTMAADQASADYHRNSRTPDTPPEPTRATEPKQPAEQPRETRAPEEKESEGSDEEDDESSPAREETPLRQPEPSSESTEDPSEDPKRSERKPPLEFIPPEPRQTSESPRLDEEEIAEPEAVELEALSPAAVANLSPTERWRKVVGAVRDYSQPTAATCEHAYVESFDDGVLDLSLPDRYADIIRENDRLELVEEVVRQLFGQTWTVSIQPRSVEESDAQPSLAEEREENRRQIREDLKKRLRNNPAVREAQELFDVDDEEVKVQVKLFDEF